MATDELSLSDLAAASGVEARTIRSWVAQGILPAPLTRGPAARYPADTLERVRAVRVMRDVLGMPLGAIRKELLVASQEKIRAHAEQADGLPAQAAPMAAPASSALDYIGALRGRELAAPVLSAPAAPMPARGFAALEDRLGEGRREPVRRSRAEAWLHIPVTPDVELAVRAPLDDEQRTRLERCADLIRDILLGRDQ